MKKIFKEKIKEILDKWGYKLHKKPTSILLAEMPIKAAIEYIGERELIFFDVGMNHGQTLREIRKIAPEAIIHGFEPSKRIFSELRLNVSSEKTYLNNCAVGGEKGRVTFNEYSWDALNSVLERAYSTAKIIDKYDVDVMTIDDYCNDNKIDHIHFLKSDTEGFELQVLKGAENMLASNSIQFIQIELFFNLNFIGQSSAGDIFNMLEKYGFSFIRFSQKSYLESGMLSKADAFFINTNYKL